MMSSLVKNMKIPNLLVALTVAPQSNPTNRCFIKKTNFAI